MEGFALMSERLDPLQGRRCLVLGLGATGLSVVRYLLAAGAEIRIADDRSSPPGLAALQALAPQLHPHLGGWPEPDLRWAETLVISPGLSLQTPVIAEAAARGVEVVGDIELFARAVGEVPVVAITGSNGKSTVTTLVGELLAAAGRRVAVGGNLGTPALDLLLSGEVPDAYVLELSSFQLEATRSLAARVATVLNVSADHLDRHGDLDAYASIKGRVLRLAETLVVNRDDPLAAGLAAATPGAARRLGFTLGRPQGRDFGLLQVAGQDWLAQGEQPLLPAAGLALPGRHNQANALAALALVSALGVDPAEVAAALRDFRGLAHRCQLVGEGRGLRFYDDSKGTNVGATVAAVTGLQPPLVLIAGGDGKGQDFRPLAEVLAARGPRLRGVVLLGRDAPRIAAAIAALAPGLDCLRVADMAEAVRAAGALAQPGDAVLLSPACASYDMYANYLERGRDFAQAVQQWLR